MQQRLRVPDLQPALLIDSARERRSTLTYSGSPSSMHIRSFIHSFRDVVYGPDANDLGWSAVGQRTTRTSHVFALASRHVGALASCAKPVVGRRATTRTECSTRLVHSVPGLFTTYARACMAHPTGDDCPCDCQPARCSVTR